MIRKIVVLFFAIFAISVGNAQEKKYKVHTVAFYNLENLFDTINDPKINDEEYLPSSPSHWTLAKYRQKQNNLARVISQLGVSDKNANCPTILGVAEIENRRVLEDLVKQPELLGKDYGIVHFDSPDKRGIDTGLLYQKKYFKPTSYKAYTLIVSNNESAKKDETEEKTDDKITTDHTGRIYTRDQLLVTGLLDGEEVSFIVNHWPSRSGGEKKSSPLREAAAALNKKIIDSLYKVNPNAKVITMGDLNDGPYNNSIKKVLGAKGHREEVKEGGLFNPMEQMAKDGMGTLAYRDAWDIFDQMIVSEPLIRKDFTSFRYWKAGIFNKGWMTQQTGQWKGYPLRNSSAEPGYSDHFPVYLYLVKQM